MGLGTSIRLSRIFAHSSGNLFGAAIDHFVGYGNVREGGLANLPAALAKVMAAGPDSVTIQAGAARHLWPKYAGQAALIVQAAAFVPDDRIRVLHSNPDHAVRYGADALAVAIQVRGDTEGDYIRWLTDSVAEASRVEMPVIAHIYPRDFSDGVKIVFTPDEIAYAVRVGVETGVDVIKVGYPGDFDVFKEIIDGCPVPIVVAGGPKVETLHEALGQVSDAMRAGAKGAVVGRNIWGNVAPITAARAYKAVIHDHLDPDAALSAANA